jgi:hypothetical protein
MATLKLMKKQLMLLLLMAYGSITYAQDSTPKPNTIPQTSNSTNASPSKKGFGIGLVLSTNGFGGHLSYSFLNSGKLTARLEGNTLNYTLKDYDFKFGKTEMLVNGPLKLGSVGLYADWHPFGNSFKLIGGFAYMLTNISTTSYLKDSTKQGDITIAPDEVGSIVMVLQPNAIAPYLGLGFGRAVPKSRVGVTFEMGMFYIGEPKVSFITTGMLTPTGITEEEKLKENMSQFKWLPNLSLTLNIRLSK